MLNLQTAENKSLDQCENKILMFKKLVKYIIISAKNSIKMQN